MANYSAKERQDYHNKLSKQGATKRVVDAAGQEHHIVISDFERGIHRAKADQIFNARKRHKEKILAAEDKPRRSNKNNK